MLDENEDKRLRGMNPVNQIGTLENGLKCPLPIVTAAEKQAAEKPFPILNVLINVYIFIRIINMMKNVLNQIVHTAVKNRLSQNS